MTRGRLRVYLGAAPGGGKTYAMLSEAHRQADRGVDRVIGVVESHGRRPILRLAEGLATVPQRTVPYHNGALREMDLDAVPARNLQVVPVDELALSGPPGPRAFSTQQNKQACLLCWVDWLMVTQDCWM
ncbi:hypothetical protein [Nocardia africana]|uniref:Sensor protein KdpD n=1 Tax=Nocardia africana TaxID=134964 RepID=A0A378WZ46_9NOCA|nr:hypothetical protein [Nocardia africana]MCC3312986.1 hypothetical protein [Nocardia africana]SUA45671.1 Sensor protein KdpD [Nocardia africana]